VELSIARVRKKMGREFSDVAKMMEGKLTRRGIDWEGN